MQAERRNPFDFNRLSRIASLLVTLLAWSVPATGQDRSVPQLNMRPRVPKYEPGQPVQKRVLKNGVTLLVQEQRTSERVVGMIGLHVGTLYESDDQAGHCQILMRTLPTGTASRTPAELELAIKAAGAEVKSEAAADQGSISVTGNRESTDQLVDLLASIALEPSFPESTFERSRRACLVRASEETESPIKATYTMFLGAMYRGSPLQRPVVGTVRAIAECRRSDLVQLHKRLFVGANLVVAFVGNVEAGRLLDRLEKRFAAAPTGPVPAPEPGEPLPLDADTTLTAERSYKARSLVFGFPAPGFLDPDHVAFRVIEGYLNAPERSPVAFWIQQRNEAFGIGVLYPPYPRRSSISVHLGAAPATWQAARDTVASVMRRLAVEPLDETDWFSTIDRVQSALLYEQNDPYNRAARMVQYEVMGLGYDHLKRIDEALVRLTPEDVRAAAARWFTHSCEANIAPLKSESKL